MKKLIPINRSIIPACDINNLGLFAKIISETAELEKVGAYKVVLVGGGCGIAGISLFAYQHDISQIFLAAKEAEHLFFRRFMKHHYLRKNISLATEDGSLGYKGLVTDLLKDKSKGDFFINCGPKAMVDRAVDIEKKFTTLNRIYSSMDYMTRCGVGICGSCANENGYRTCVEGPFINSI